MTERLLGLVALIMVATACSGGAGNDAAADNPPGTATCDSLVARGGIEAAGVTVDYDSLPVAKNVKHKIDIDAAEDGCIYEALFELKRERGCALRLEFGAVRGTRGGLRKVELTADSFCPGFPDDKEGTYRLIGGHGPLDLLSPTRVPDRSADASCIDDLAIRFPDRLLTLQRHDGRTIEVNLAGLTLVGSTRSRGVASATCLETGCAEPFHDDGTGWCVSSSCASGFHSDGAGRCVPEGRCAAGHHDGGDGTCVENGRCSTGYHDDGDGQCVAHGCATGFHDDGTGVCVSTGCAEGYANLGGGCEPCSPLTCSEQGKECGQVPDGCGRQLDCGSCSPPLSCGGGGVANVCGCTPTITCESRGQNCDTFVDDCGTTVECGSCASPQTCGGDGSPGVCGCRREWQQLPLTGGLATVDWRAVRGTTRNNVWIIGGGTVLRWDGTRLSSVNVGTWGDWHDLWVTANSDVWIAGSQGKLIRSNGASWTVVQAPNGNFNAIDGSSLTNVWLAADGNIVTRFDGTSWSSSASTSPGSCFPGCNYTDIAVVSENDVSLTDAEGSYHWDGTRWTRGAAFNAVSAATGV